MFKYLLLIFILKVEQNVTARNFNLFKSRGINEALWVDEHTIEKRAVDTTFRGKPKLYRDILANNFQIESNDFGQSDSLVKLLNKIAVEYLSKCPPFIYYDSFVEKSDSFILQKLFTTFPLTFYQSRIDPDNPHHPHHNGDENCRSYILFLSNPETARKILGPQTTSRVVLVARSSQWLLREFLSSKESSDIVNLLVIGESLTDDDKREQPYVLYTHQLYSDGIGSNKPIVLTSWIKNVLSRPHVNLFPPKFAHGFSGHRFLVSAVNQPPFIFRQTQLDNTGTSNIYWDGIEYRLMELIAKRLNFSYEIQEPANSNFFGTGEAVRQAVQFGKADIGMAGVYITVERLDQVDMSIGHSRDCATFVTLASKALPKYRAIMGPFQWTVWVALIAVYLGAIIPLSFTDRLSLRYLIGNYSEMQNMFWYVFGTFTNSLTFTGEYSWSNSERTSTRLLVGFYWVFTIIITACYTGSIIAFVTLPAFPDTVDSVNDLLGLFYRVVTLDKGGWEQWFQNSTHDSTAKLYKKMEFVGNIYEGIGNVTKSFIWNYAFLGSGAQLEYLIQSNFSADNLGKRSALHLSKECFAPFHVGYTFPKNSVYTDKINTLILVIQESGLLSKISNEVSWAMQRSSTGKLLKVSSGHALKEILQEERQLSTADTEGMFLLMAFGYLAGLIALISEMIGGFSNKCRQIVRRNRPPRGNSSTIHDEDDVDHGDSEKVSFKSRFLAINKLELSKATIKELFSGSRESQPTIIMQNGQLMYEKDARSTDSSICGSLSRSPASEGDEGVEIREALEQLDECCGDDGESEIRVDIESHSLMGVDHLFGSFVDPLDLPTGNRNLYPFLDSDDVVE